MASAAHSFVCLDPRKTKRARIMQTLGPVGPLEFLRIPPMGLRDYPQTQARVDAALANSKKLPKSGLLTMAKRWLLRRQYNGTRKFFEAASGKTAVVWNGLNGSRNVFAQAARDAGNPTLFFELSPLKGRITVDPCGVNFHNGLPRQAAPYLNWAKATPPKERWRDVAATITARAPLAPVADGDAAQPLSEPFIFVPLQVPGDSQLRLFGGAFRTVETVIDAVAAASDALPKGWHLRIKEHPTAKVRFADRISAMRNPRVVLDNVTDTFAQVAACQALVTINSSVGLEAMFFEKPVAAMGDCFWAIDGIAAHLPSVDALRAAFTAPDTLGFDPQARDAFLRYITEVYYPVLNDAPVTGTALERVSARLNGPDAFGFWQDQLDTRP